VRTGQTRFGINISTYITPGLDYPATIVVHPEFVKASGLANVAMILGFNPERMKYVAFSGNGVSLDTHVRTNVQDAGPTIRVDEWYTGFSLECRWEKLHNVLLGITQA
jgi:hypothetical protein